MTAMWTFLTLETNVRELYYILWYVPIKVNGDDIHEYEWLEHLIREQDLEEKCSQPAEGPFHSC